MWLVSTYRLIKFRWTVATVHQKICNLETQWFICPHLIIILKHITCPLLPIESRLSIGRQKTAFTIETNVRSNNEDTIMPAAAGESVPVGPGHRETNLSHKKVPKTFNVRELFDVLPLASYFMYLTRDARPWRNGQSACLPCSGQGFHPSDVQINLLSEI